MQTMLGMVGLGDNADSGFPAILATWKNEGLAENRQNRQKSRQNRVKFRKFLT